MDDLSTAEQYRTLADLIERRGRKGSLATFQGWLLWANPDYPLVRIFSDGAWEEVKFIDAPSKDDPT